MDGHHNGEDSRVDEAFTGRRSMTFALLQNMLMIISMTSAV